tara:strand:- start:1362 stop:1973 length:612 start_codon:yes stop_codon:yes gene_type:complete
MTDLETKVATSLETLHLALNSLEPAIEHVKSVVKASEAVKKIINENEKFLNNQRDLNDEHKVKLVASLDEGVDRISKKSHEVLDGVKSSTEDIVKLDQSINDYLEAIKKIDFPTRLTSIENDISSVSSALNNIQGTVNNIQNEIIRLERETRSDIKSLSQNVNKGNDDISLKIAQINKENKTLKILVIVVMALSMASVLANFI